MPKTQCNTCSKEFELKSQFEGKKAKCSQCWNTFTITFTKNDQENFNTEVKKIETNPKKKENKFINFLKHTIKSPSILVNFLLMIHVIIFIILNTVWDILLSIFAGIIIPLVNIFVLVKFKNNNEKKSVFLIILNILLNVWLFFLLIFFLIDNWIPKQWDDLITALLLFLVPCFSLYYVLKDNITLTKIIKCIKWFLITLLTWLIVLLISIYISRLDLYTPEDFNIPEDFFQTKFSHLDENSWDNWLNDVIDFYNMLNNREDIKYFDILSECIFNNESTDTRCDKNKMFYINKYKNNTISVIQKELNQIKHDSTNPKILEYNTLIKKITNNETIPIKYISEFESLEEYVDIKNDFEGFINKKYFKTFQNFTHVNSFKFKQINSKDFISFNDAYKNSDAWVDLVSFTWFSNYLRAIRYVAYHYAEKWEYEKAIWILLEHQKFIDMFINKTDTTTITALVLINKSKINLNAIKYLLENYPVTPEIKNNLKNILEEEINENFIVNTLKVNHNLERWIFQEIYNTSFIQWHFDSTIWVWIESIKAYLFYDVKETELLSDKIMYDVLNSPKYTSDFTCWFNMSNYIWRNLICNNIKDVYQTSYFDKFDQLLQLRENILESVK